MNIGSLNDRELLINTKKLVLREREILSEILNHLYEIERRRLYSDLKYSSLFNYCMTELGYSEQEAFRRIDAMRLSKKNKIVKQEIENGKLSLTNANMLSSLFKSVNIEDKEKVVKEISGKSKRECERKIIEIKRKHGITAEPKKEIKINEDDGGVRLHISLKKSTKNKLEKLKGLLANEKEYSTEELIDLMADHLIKKVENKRFKAKNNVKQENKNSRYIQRKAKKAVYLNSHGKCENCGSTYALQIDHKIRPYAKGGLNNKENLQILCRNCNSRKSILEYGQSKIDYFFQNKWKENKK